MSAEERKYLVTPLPSTEQLICFAVDGRVFQFRRPTVGDQDRAARLYAAKCVITGMPGEGDVLAETGDRDRFWFESRLEVGLVGYRNRTGILMDGEEKAPANWLEEVNGEKLVSFDKVDADELDAVCRYLNETVFAPKKKENQMASSGNAVVAPRNV